jgi:hypothetical protein
VTDWLGFYWDVFVRQFLVHWPIAACVALVAFIIAGGLRGLGIPYLFWRPRWWACLGTGFATGVLTVICFFVSYLLDADRTAPVMERCAAFGWVRGWCGGWYLFGCGMSLAATMLVVLVVAALLRLAARDVRGGSRPWVGHGVWPAFALGLIGGIAAAAFLWRSAENGGLGTWLLGWSLLDFMPRGGAFPAGHRLALLIFVGLALAFLISFIFRYRALPAAISICALLAMAAAADGFCVYWLRPTVIAFFALAALLALGGFPRYKIRLPALSYKTRIRLEDHWAVPRYGRQTRELPVWTDSGPTLVLVAVSGGGLRAAVWTAAVLTELEKQERAGGPLLTPYNLGFITGASGGMVGATYYTVTLRTAPGDGWHIVDANTLLEAVAEESLSDIAQRLVFHDLPFAFFPGHSDRDRGERLDAALERHLTSRLDGKKIVSTVAALREHEQVGAIPSLVYTPMLVEDGRRLFISNANLARQTTSDGALLNGGTLYSRNAFEFRDLFADGMKSLSPWTAARLSASFPYVTPATVLPTVPRRRVVDAGYWDNFGVNLSASWLEDCLCVAARREWLSRFRNVLLLQIRDGVLAYSAKVGPKPDDEPTSMIARGAEWLSSPPQAVLAARNAVSVYRGDDQVESLSEILGDRFSTAVLELDDSASLSWSLTKAEVKNIRDGATRAVDTLAPDIRDFVSRATDPLPRPAWFHDPASDPEGVPRSVAGPTKQRRGTHSLDPRQRSCQLQAE